MFRWNFTFVSPLKVGTLEKLWKGPEKKLSKNSGRKSTWKKTLEKLWAGKEFVQPRVFPEFPSTGRTERALRDFVCSSSSRLSVHYCTLASRKKSTKGHGFLYHFSIFLHFSFNYAYQSFYYQGFLFYFSKTRE